MLRGTFLEEDSVLPEIRDVSNIYNWSKDGKMRLKPDDKEMRK
jgi:hypothetical protein